MTAVIFHGPPGSYKTFSATQDIVIPALLAGRIVVTNIRGLNDIDRIEQALSFDNRPWYQRLFKKFDPPVIPPQADILTLPHSVEGFADMARFYHWAPKGALIVMDEGQRVYPTRTRSFSDLDYPGGKERAEQDSRPATLEDAFDQHRHYNWDIYITTTHIDKIHKEIRQICEYGYRHRDLSGFLPWWKNKFKVIKHDPSNNGTAQSHPIGPVVIKKADRRIFDCYQSTATGIAKDSTESKTILRSPKLIAVVGILLVAIVINIKSVSALLSDDEPQKITVAAKASPGLSDAALPVVSHAPGSPLGILLERNRIRYLGYMIPPRRVQGIHYFESYNLDTDKGTIITHHDLERLGISSSYAGCTATLADSKTSTIITCA